MTDPVPIHTPDRQSHCHPELVSGSMPQQVQRSTIDEWMLERVQHDDASIDTDWTKPQTYCEIMPIGVFAFDQIDLPLPVPTLQLLLSRNGSGHRAKHLEPDEPVDDVSGSKSFGLATTMLPKASNQVARDADVERTAWLAGENIDAGVSLDFHATTSAAIWTLKQVQGDKKVLKIW